MNVLAIDYGSKRVGFAYSIQGIISTLPPAKNDKNILPHIQDLISQFAIKHVYVGLSEGEFAAKTKVFVAKLSSMLELPVETVEEAISTIEANQIYKNNSRSKKDYKKSIDSLAAAVILRRVIN